MSRARDDLGLLTPRQMCDYQTAVVAHKVCSTGEPSDLAALFHTYAEARSGVRVTRQDQSLRPPDVRTAAGQRSFAFRATKLLNSMPDEFRDLDLGAFKRAVTTFLNTS